ncbi:PilW family protein [Mesobacillus harenae]|uniref:PilW family protein n=1 Tax=Mesobacillus harenae TaxID=2213203 RepID=UPI001580069B|nr:type II secretion system protein [Mesobacillus harenae]
MNRQLLASSKGMTLVELLGSLALFSLISAGIMGNLIGGMDSFKVVSKEISLHDEANYIMSQFTEKVFVATQVEVVEQSDCVSLIKIKDFEGAETILGFKNNKAVINDKAIHSSLISTSCTNGEQSKLVLKNDTVFIKMFVQDKSTERDIGLELDSEVSFVKVE